VLIVADPAWRNRKANPYNAKLSDALVDLGHEVKERRGFSGHRGDASILHVHWPDSVWGRRHRLQAYLLAVWELVDLWRWRRAGAVLVWTAHNTWAHNRRYRHAERLWWRVLPRLLDGCIGLSQPAANEVVAAHPALAGKTWAVIPHGHYRGEYAPARTRDEVRSELGVAPEAFLVCFAGRVKEYKGVLELLTAFRAVEDPTARLVVAGLCVDPALRESVKQAAASDARVVVRLVELSPAEMADLVSASDLLALPYRQVLNSGSALLGLSLGVPVLLPAGPLAEDLAAGDPGWVRSVEQLDGVSLTEQMQVPRPSGVPVLGGRGWEEIAVLTTELYESCLKTRR
jgi:beta-1,4-mannosyltransferase